MRPAGKRCYKCGMEKQLAEFYVGKTGRLHSYCKPCTKSGVASWQKSNASKVRSYRKKINAKPSRRAAQRAKNRREYRDHRDRVVARLAKHRKTDKFRARINRWLKTPKGRAIRARYASKPEVQARLKLRRSMPSRKFVEATGAARRRGAIVAITKEDWLLLLARFENSCAYCGATGKLTIEHMQPLSRSGTHARGNVVPACLKCNIQKGSRTLIEYAALKNFDAAQVQQRASL